MNQHLSCLPSQCGLRLGTLHYAWWVLCPEQLHTLQPLRAAGQIQEMLQGSTCISQVTHEPSQWSPGRFPLLLFFSLPPCSLGLLHVLKQHMPRKETLKTIWGELTYRVTHRVYFEGTLQPWSKEVPFTGYAVPCLNPDPQDKYAFVLHLHPAHSDGAIGSRNPLLSLRQQCQPLPCLPHCLSTWEKKGKAEKECDAVIL